VRPGRLLLALGLVALLGATALADTIADALDEVVRRTAEYQATLGRLLALQEQEATRVEAIAERYRGLLPGGFVSRRDVETAEAQAAAARARVEHTRAQIEETGRVALEAQAAARLALLPPVPPGQERATPEAIQYHGAGSWSPAQLASVESFFSARFGRPLPVSALGQTAVHDRLGLDHRNAVDIALHPDSREGRSLIEHLRVQRVPFLAFRGAVRGASTGAHVHIGEPSPRKS
jgi:hypothetical protein